MLISEALDLKGRAFISLVGAGGKSILFRRLAEELIEQEKRIILTTTTKMFAWQLDYFLKEGILVEGEEERVVQGRVNYFFAEQQRREIVVIRWRKEEGREIKYLGLPPEWLDKWWEEGLADFFLVEADGAAGRPIKAPAAHEPVIPSSTTDLVGVIGIDAWDLPLQEENVFRSQIFTQLTGAKLGEKIGIEALNALICHPEGLFKNTPQDCRCHLFINKVENSKAQKAAEELALQVLKTCHQRISDIIIGAAGQEEVVVELIKEEKAL